jgi:nucleoside-diphosphate-sugar epimerase
VSATNSGRRVLLTGATGFIGSQVARSLLEAGCSVHALIRPGADTSRIDGLLEGLTLFEGVLETLTDPEVLGAIRPEICLHLAWYAEPGRYLRAVAENLACLRSSLSLVEALARSGCARMLVAGTCAEYHPHSGDEPFGERDPIGPATTYARAKAALYLVAQDVASAAGMELTWARLFFLYGPGEDPRRVVPSVVRAALAGRTLPATAGEQVRDYLHVADAGRALVALALSEVSGPVNVCSGTPVTLRSVLEVAERAARRPGTVLFGQVAYAPDEWMSLWGVNTRLLATGWRPRVDLATGLADTVAWWRGQQRTGETQDSPPPMGRDTL